MVQTPEILTHTTDIMTLAELYKRTIGYDGEKKIFNVMMMLTKKIGVQVKNRENHDKIIQNLLKIVMSYR